MKLVPMNAYQLRHSVSFYCPLLSFCFQITYESKKNLQICIKMLIGKSVLLYHAKAAAWTISVIIDLP